MRIKILYSFLMIGMLALGSQSAAGCAPSASREDSQKEAAFLVADNRSNQVDQRRANVLRARYAPLSTMSSTLLITVQDEKSEEQAAIVIDHAYWRKVYAQTNNPAVTQDAYEEVMMDHLLNHKPFAVNSEIYAKLKKLEAPEPDPELMKLSIDEIAQRFLRPIPRSRRYWTVQRGVKMDRAFIRLLLEKGCVLNSSCLDGSPMISW